MLKLQNEHTLD